MLKEALVKIKNLSKTFVVEKTFLGKPTKILKAVNNISLEVYPGECLTIVGESGSGKSTLARLIIKLIKPDSGEVLFEGKNFFNRKDIQMVFQNPFNSLDPKYKVADSIAEPIAIHYKDLSKTEIKTKVNELLKLVELDPSIGEKYPHECSGGQNQRICIARAIATNPKFLIADEAVSALDVSTQTKILELFKKLQKELNISILFITHNLGVVKYIADRVAVMYLGEIVELATKDEIFANPLHPYTKALFSSAPIADPTKRNREKILLKGEIPKPTAIPSGCPFHTRCPIAEAKCKEIKPALRHCEQPRFARYRLLEAIQTSSELVAQGNEHLVSCLLVD